MNAAVAEEAISILLDEGSLDDARYARLFVQDKRELQEWGAERIRGRLRVLGLDRELIETALSGVVQTPQSERAASELERALSILGRRFPSLPRGRRERDRALGVLIRKGYEPELALDALRTYARGGRLDA